jgi:protein tyrosine/serine phosphatase
MVSGLFQRIHRFERDLHNRLGRDISTPAARRGAWWHYQFLDHGILRHLWTNLDEVAPGVYRSNQPAPGRLRLMAARGIRTVLNLRGATPHSPYLFERETCDALGMTLVDLRLNARRAPPRAALLELIDLLETLETPLLIHCKSGADRAGLASAIYLLIRDGSEIAGARRMLSWRYLHLRSTATGVLDQVIEDYAARRAGGDIGFRDWVAQDYDPETTTANFSAHRGRA